MKEITILTLTMILLLVSTAYAVTDEKLAKFIDMSYLHSQEIYKRFPPSEYHVVLLGKTGMGMAATLLRELDNKKARQDYITEFPVEILKNIVYFGPEDKKKFFRRLLPSKKKLNGRKVVITRVLWLSHTMGFVIEDMLEFLESNDYKLPLKSYFIADFGVDEIDYALRDRHNFDLSLVTDKDYFDLIFQDIDRKKTDQFYPYSRFMPFSAEDVILPTFKKVENKKYKVLKNAIEKTRTCKEGVNSIAG